VQLAHSTNWATCREASVQFARSTHQTKKMHKIHYGTKMVHNNCVGLGPPNKEAELSIDCRWWKREGLGEGGLEKDAVESAG